MADEGKFVFITFDVPRPQPSNARMPERTQGREYFEVYESIEEYAPNAVYNKTMHLWKVPEESVALFALNYGEILEVREPNDILNTLFNQTLNG